MRRPIESVGAPLILRQQSATRDSHAKCVKIYRLRSCHTRFSRVFEPKPSWHHPCYREPSACGWSPNLSTSSNMNVDPAASGKLCSVLTSGVLLLFEGSRRFKTGPRIQETAGDNPRSLLFKRKGSPETPGAVSCNYFWNRPARRFVFLLLYLTRRVILDNRLGLPEKFDGFRAAQTCRPLCHNCKC
jgi:hypothetical protein